MTLDHQSTELLRQKRTADLLGALLVKIPRGASMDDVAAIVKAKHPDLIVKRDGQRLEVGEVLLEFHGDTLARISPM